MSRTAASVLVAPPSTPSTKRASARDGCEAARASGSRTSGSRFIRGILSGIASPTRIVGVRTKAIFPSVAERVGMYESFYLRAASRDEPVGVWIRNTVHKAPGGRPKGSVWCTVFDARKGRPYMHKLTSDLLKAPHDDW